MSPSCPAWAPPLLAVQFLTRVPVPFVSRLSEEVVRVGLSRAVAWFPLVGALIGAVTAGTVLLAEQVWPRVVAVIIALIVEARLTGAFHEDAVADFCDGVGGGRDPAHTRQIMKDSRIGTYGALGLTLAVALRAVLTGLLDPAVLVFAIIAAAAFARLLAVIVMAIVPAIALPSGSSAARGASSPDASAAGTLLGASGLGKDVAAGTPLGASGFGKDVAAGTPLGASGLGNDIAAGIRKRDVTLAFLTSLPGLIPFALVAPLALACALLAAIAFLVWFKPLLMRHVGGSTGDCLGFAAYIGQLFVLLAATA